MAKEKYLSSRPWRRQGHLLKHPEIDLVIADFFPIREGNKMVHPNTDSAEEHAEFALRACNAHDALLEAARLAVADGECFCHAGPESLGRHKLGLGPGPCDYCVAKAAVALVEGREAK